MDFENSTQYEDFASKFSQYLNSREMVTKVQEMINTNKTRLPLNLDDLRQKYPSMVPGLLKNPIPCLKILQATLNAVIEDLNNDGTTNKKRRAGDVTQKKPSYTFAFEGNFAKNHITPRGLNSQTIHNLVAVNGIVTRMSIVRPKLLQSVHYCDATNLGRIKEYYDQYNLVSERYLQTQSNAFPRKDENDNPLVTEYGFCKYKDHQTLLVQEMPEKAPAGMMPHSIEVILEDDLVDKVKPGDRVQVVGIYKAITQNNTHLNAMFRGALVATNIQVLTTEVDVPKIQPEDIQKIQEISKRKDAFKLLSSSIAPSIYGHSYIKKAILLLLLGGVEKTLENRAHLRGDINLLMIGDPSTAKSQLLRRVLTLAPLALNTTGRGSSGVGLTAAITYDKDTGEKHLEAGAMVLADRGIVCIDEFDKMEENDRVAVHEVMEQQTVTIAKAGIHTSLNARCSVVAAANPIYGEYQKDLPPTKNIGLPDSLLSRFDFIFIVLDEKNSELDRMIAERVTRNHRFKKQNQEEYSMLFEATDDYVIEPEINNESQSNDVFEKYNATIHDQSQTELISQQFLKKYIYFAKRRVTPQIKDDTIEFISNAWTHLRQKEQEEGQLNTFKTMSITIRTLETLIRIATAHAKMRLSQEVDIVDCKVALELIYFTLFNEIPDKHLYGMLHERGREGEDSDYDEDLDDDSDGDDDDYNGNRKQSKNKVKRTPKKILQKKQLSTKKSKKSDSQIIDESSSQDKDIKKAEKNITKQLKKMDIKDKDDDDVEDFLTGAIAADITVSSEAKKFVFREFNKARGKKPQITLPELWSHIQKILKEQSHSIRESLQREEGLIKALTMLDDDTSIFFDKDKKMVISL